MSYSSLKRGVQFDKEGFQAIEHLERVTGIEPAILMSGNLS